MTSVFQSYLDDIALIIYYLDDAAFCQAAANHWKFSHSNLSREFALRWERLAQEAFANAIVRASR